MTRRTKTYLVDSVIGTLLADNTTGDISPEDLRTGFIDTIDSVVFMEMGSAPSSSSEACTTGEIRVATTDGITFLYVCVATNTWQRSELASF